MKTISIAALVAVLVGAVALAVTRPGAAHGSAAPGDRTVTVSGTATAHGAPDTALFSFGVDTEGATAKATLAANAAEMRRVIVALVRTGVARADIQTQNVSVYPDRTDSGEVEGYSVSGSVTAKVRRLARAGAAVDAAVAAGANETSGPQFDRSSRSELTRRALQDAFADARAKAETLAKEAGASLGQVRRIDEAAQAPQPVPMGGYAAALAEKTPIEPGTQELQANVTVTFTLA
jgi:uncharacterized protein YggE